MGIVKNKTKVNKARLSHSKKKVALTKKQKIAKRASRMQKMIEYRKNVKRAKRGKVVPIKKRKQLEADQQIIDYSTKRQYDNNTASDAEINILGILGLTQNPNNQETIQNSEWEHILEAKLKEANEKSLDNPEVRRVYGEIGRIFATYRSGKIPRAFKIIPNLQKWEEVLMITRPDNWTPQAMFQAVNIFASNFDANRAEEFYEKFLVPAIKLDLSKNKKLNYHYYESLKKSLYKTHSWFKGILFNFCSPSTLIREISVMESLLSKMSIPVISSSVGIIKMIEMEPSTAIFHYLKALMNKSYNFPKKVINLMTNYLMKIAHQSKGKELPVVWHQLVLNFVRQYGSNIDEMMKQDFIGVIKGCSHKLVTPQILKQLNA